MLAAPILAKLVGRGWKSALWRVSIINVPSALVRC